MLKIRNKWEMPDDFDINDKFCIEHEIEDEDSYLEVTGTLMVILIEEAVRMAKDIDKLRGQVSDELWSKSLWFVFKQEREAEKVLEADKETFKSLTKIDPDTRMDLFQMFRGEKDKSDYYLVAIEPDVVNYRREMADLEKKLEGKTLLERFDIIMDS